MLPTDHPGFPPRNQYQRAIDWVRCLASSLDRQSRRSYHSWSTIVTWLKGHSHEPLPSGEFFVWPATMAMVMYCINICL
jgi:hypothetical protein